MNIAERLTGIVKALCCALLVATLLSACGSGDAGEPAGPAISAVNDGLETTPELQDEVIVTEGVGSEEASTEATGPAATGETLSVELETCSISILNDTVYSASPLEVVRLQAGGSCPTCESLNSCTETSTNTCFCLFFSAG